jgi:hypothetical protein
MERWCMETRIQEPQINADSHGLKFLTTNPDVHRDTNNTKKRRGKGRKMGVAKGVLEL